jgi:starch synthase
MKSVLFIAAEAGPLLKTGGLGDVVGSLPKELQRQGLDVRVIIPKYGDIPNNWQEQMKYVTHITVPVAWRQQYCGLFEMVHEGITYYLIDNEFYFKRRGAYGFFDDGERFAFFCRAVLEVIPLLDFKPDILHCHDWHTAIIPVLLKALYGHKPEYANLKTVLTIHNIEYQGNFDHWVVENLLGINSAEYFTPQCLEFFGRVNFLKGGICQADAVTTVSKTYADEIRTPEGGHHLDGVFRFCHKKLQGIINGIDFDEYDPSRKNGEYINYTAKTIGHKRENKEKIQEYLCLPVNGDIPVIAMITRLVAAKGLDLVTAVLEDIMARDVQLILLGTGNDKYESIFRIAAHRYPDKLSANLYFDEVMARRIYAGADIFLMPSLSEPCGIGQLIALRYGCIPLVRETGGLKDTIIPYNEYTGEGNGFSFTNYNAHDMLYTLDRALGFYHDPKVWPNLVKAAMASDYSWQRSASEYAQLYDRL